jgi:hypothetical protein
MPNYDSRVVGADEVFFPEVDDGSGGGCQGKVLGVLILGLGFGAHHLIHFLSDLKKRIISFYLL